MAGGYAPVVPSLASWLKFLHVVVAFGFVGGLIGRNLTHRQALRSFDISTVSSLLDLAGRFERWLIVPGSIVVLFGGLLTMWAEHRPLFERGGYWLVTSLAVFIVLFSVLVPFVFILKGSQTSINALTTGSVSSRGALRLLLFPSSFGAPDRTGWRSSGA
jgi:hypothetical protein